MSWEPGGSREEVSSGAEGQACLPLPPEPHEDGGGRHRGAPREGGRACLPVRPEHQEEGPTAGVEAALSDQSYQEGQQAESHRSQVRAKQN